MRINLELNSKRQDIVGPAVLFLSKTTRCNDIYTTSQKFLNGKILNAF